VIQWDLFFILVTFSLFGNIGCQMDFSLATLEPFHFLLVSVLMDSKQLLLFLISFVVFL
jgi:hypothetical protein